MSNGHTALRVLAPEPVPAVVDQLAPEIDIRLGEAVALGAVFISAGVDDYRRSGVLNAANKAATADQIAAVAMLQLDYTSGDDADFLRTARAAGRAVLRQYVIAGCPLQRADAAIDNWIDALFEVVGSVVRQERAIRTAWAN